MLEYKRPRMAELADAHDSKSCGAIHVGSTPTLGTILNIKVQSILYFLYALFG